MFMSLYRRGRERRSVLATATTHDMATVAWTYERRYVSSKQYPTQNTALQARISGSMRPSAAPKSTITLSSENPQIDVCGL